MKAEQPEWLDIWHKDKIHIKYAMLNGFFRI